MKLRRLAGAALAAVMCVSAVLTVGAAPAAPGADARLTKVTQKVKDTLSIPDSYKSFSGEPQENYLGTRWELRWSGDNGNLYVTATDEGKVLSMSRDTVSASSGDRYDPRFPSLTRAQAQQKAQAFLDKVLTAGETARFSNGDDAPSLSRESISLRGTVYLNGLPSPLSFSIRVLTADGSISSFHRDDVSNYVGALPEAKSAIAQEDAAALLKGVLALRLEYVSGSDGKKAVLRYLPEDRHEYYVDAATGKLVDLTELQQTLYETAASGGADNGAMMDAAAPMPSAAPEEAADRKQLTEEELAGIAKLEDLLSSDELEQKARVWKELALDGFERASAGFTVDKENDKVTASLTFVKRDEEKRTARRYVTLDAKTGELLSVSGYNPYNDDDEAKLDKAAAQAKAEAFLKALWPGQFAKTEAYSAEGGEKGYPVFNFQFAQKENGYFFPENNLSVRVDGMTGAIIGLSRVFDEKIVFDSPDGIISMEDALTAWAASYAMELGYIEVPVRLDLLGSEAKPLIEAGLSYFNALKPGYGLDQGDTSYRGVDAKTGKLVEWERYSDEAITYSDIKGHWAESALNELAEYRIGWTGGKALPDAALTQKDLIILLASAGGYTFDTENENADALYQYAYYRGFLTQDERAENQKLTRLDTVKLLINALGYRTAAGLPGIYRCDYKDAGQIPANALGYAALAQGLGIVPAGNGTSFEGSRAATRAEAAVMLWRYMKG